MLKSASCHNKPRSSLKKRKRERQNLQTVSQKEPPGRQYSPQGNKVEYLNSGKGDGHCLLIHPKAKIWWREDLEFPTMILGHSIFFNGNAFANSDERNFAEFLFERKIKAYYNVPYIVNLGDIKDIAEIPPYPVDVRFPKPVTLGLEDGKKTVDALELKGQKKPKISLLRAEWLTQNLASELSY